MERRGRKRKERENEKWIVKERNSVTSSVAVEGAEEITTYRMCPSENVYSNEVNKEREKKTNERKSNVVFVICNNS